MTKKKPFKKNKNEILWNLINAGIAGILVFLGACADGSLTWRGAALAIVAALVVAITKFKDYWSSQEGEYISKVFKFI